MTRSNQNSGSTPWNEFVEKVSFLKLLSRENFHENLEESTWAAICNMDFRTLGYEETRKALKPHMRVGEHRKLIQRFNNYRSKRNLNKTTITLRKDTLDILSRLKYRLGLSGTVEEGLDTLILYLADPKEFAMRERIGGSELATLNRSDIPLENRLKLLESAAPHGFDQVLAELMSLCLEAGWEACKTRKGPKTDKAKELALSEMLDTLKLKYT